MPHALKGLPKLLSLSVALLAAVGSQAVAAQREGTARRPNILLIISDDIGLDVSTTMYPGLIDAVAKLYGPQGLRHPGADAIRGRPASLPNLDRLARQGTRFTNAWAQPFCSPTRASILTGLTANKARVLSYADPLATGYTSFVRQLTEQGGYRAALFGKWHLAGLPGNPVSYPGMKPKQAGFELFRGNLHAALRTYWDYDYQVQDADTPPDRWRVEKPPVRSLPGIAPTTYAPVVKVTDAIEWITAREKEAPEQPWFAWVAFNLAHATIVQQPSAMAVPNADTLDAASLAEMKACGGEFGSMNTGRCSGEALMRAMTNSMDTMAGKLVSAVDALDPNTIVIYIGDNGTAMYGRPNLDFIDNLYITRKGRGKGTAYESGARVPLVIRGPGIAVDRESRAIVNAMDLFPTILALAGLQPPVRVSDGGGGQVALDGVSLVPALRDPAKVVRDPDRGYVLTESLNLMTNSTRQVGARNGRYKVICTENVEPGACEFFDLVADPLEEFPLRPPAACGGAETASPSRPGWHFCRLSGLIATESFLGRPRETRSIPPTALAGD